MFIFEIYHTICLRLKRIVKNKIRIKYKIIIDFFLFFSNLEL